MESCRRGLYLRAKRQKIPAGVKDLARGHALGQGGGQGVKRHRGIDAKAIVKRFREIRGVPGPQTSERGDVENPRRVGVATRKPPVDDFHGPRRPAQWAAGPQANHGVGPVARCHQPGVYGTQAGAGENRELWIGRGRSDRRGLPGGAGRWPGCRHHPQRDTAHRPCRRRVYTKCRSNSVKTAPRCRSDETPAQPPQVIACLPILTTR